MTTSAQHSPTPWTWRVRPLDDEIDIISDEAVVATVPIWSDQENSDDLRDVSHANARRIVTACNQHDALVACVRNLLPLALAEAALLADADQPASADRAWAVTDQAKQLLAAITGSAD